MKRILIPASIAATGILAAVVYAGTDPVLISSIDAGPSTASYLQFNEIFTGDWQQYGELFTSLQANLFSRIFLFVVTLVPVIFFFHYLAIGPKEFDHSGPKIYYFSLFARIIHWLAAFSFSLLVITGLLVILGKMFGGGAVIRNGRSVHILAAILFSISAIPMFLMWLKNMLPVLYDIKWMFIMGGYLSKEVKPVPAGKFNAGQKMWFWLATLGGAVMAVTGYVLFSFQGNIDTLRLAVIIHNFLGAAMMAMFFVHMYMSIAAIKGSLASMISGYKAEAELKILHPKFKY